MAGLLCRCLLLVFVICGIANAQVPDGVWVRAGYELSVAARFEFGPRFMALDDEGALYVSHPSEGSIYQAVDADGDGVFEKVTPFVRGYPRAHGVQWHDGWLYFTQPGAIHKARDTTGDGQADRIVAAVRRSQLPQGVSGHWWRSLRIHNGRIYTSIGDSGNITDEVESQRQKIWSFDLTGGDKQLYCTGIRNTEKLLIRPGTHELWGMDHGSDWFGKPLGDKPGRQPITDMNPPDEMNRYVQDGFYGHPFITGNRIPRIEYQNRKDIIDLAERTIVPAWTTPAHWAPNAMCFYTGDQFPNEVRGDAFIAFHGSWNRKQRAGYQVARVLFEDGQPYGQLSYVKFLTEDGEVRGRPVDVVVAPDGSLLISDDAGGTVYRLRYVGP